VHCGDLNCPDCEIEHDYVHGHLKPY
jgi:hypothetical protein